MVDRRAAVPEYGEILSDMNSTFQTLNHAASRIDDHVTVMAHASHLLKVAALLYATAKANAEGNVLTRSMGESLFLFLWTTGRVSTESRHARRSWSAIQSGRGWCTKADQTCDLSRLPAWDKQRQSWANCPPQRSAPHDRLSPRHDIHPLPAPNRRAADQANHHQHADARR